MTKTLGSDCLQTEVYSYSETVQNLCFEILKFSGSFQGFNKILTLLNSHNRNTRFVSKWQTLHASHLCRPLSSFRCHLAKAIW